MNPAAALDAVAAAQGPLATVQAMQALLAAMSETAAQTAVQEATGVQAAEAPPDAETVALPGDTQAVAATAQAQQGRVTLGQLAAEPAALRASNDAAPDPAARPALLPAATGGAQETERPVEALAVPVLLTALHSPVLMPVHSPKAPQPAPPQHDKHDAAADDDAAPGAETAAAAAADDEADDTEAAALRQQLQRSGQADALAELARGRCVLVVQPQAQKNAAQALLLSARGLQRFGARWWPGAAAGDGWQQWRVFRDGDPLFTRGLRSRSAGSGCLLLLGTRAPRVAEIGGAVLEVADRIRFGHALGGQWSLVLLAMPVLSSSSTAEP